MLSDNNANMKFPGGEFFILLFFLIGLTLSCISFGIYYSRTKFAGTAIPAKGIVISLNRVVRNKYPLAPSVRYRTREGQEHIFHSSVGKNPPEYQIGQEVDLFYDPRNPEDVQLKGDFFLVYIFAGIGAVFLLLSVWEVASSVKTIWYWATGV